MPDISLDLAQTVALGPFNPHIVEPKWLIRQKICNESDFKGFDFVPVGDGNEEVFRFRNQEWQVDYSRLAVSTRGAVIDERTTQAIVRVLSELPHTPVRAVGHNFHFSCKLGDWDKRRSPQLGTNAEPVIEGLQLHQTRWSGSYQGHDSRIEVSLALAKPEEIVILLFNHERPIEPGDCRSAIEAVGQFLADFDMTRQMLKELFGVSIQP